MTLVIFPEQVQFDEILVMLGYGAEDRELYKQSLEHYIWNHVLRDTVDQLSDAEKCYLQEKISEHPDDTSVIPREIARIRGHETINNSLQSVSERTLELSMSQLMHHAADNPDFVARLREVASKLQPMKIDLTEWLQKNPYVKNIFSTKPSQKIQDITLRVQNLEYEGEEGINQTLRKFGVVAAFTPQIKEHVSRLLGSVGLLLQMPERHVPEGEQHEG